MDQSKVEQGNRPQWKIVGAFNRRVHLKIKGADTTLCGRPQENYDTSEGQYSLQMAINSHRRDLCKTCTNKAYDLEITFPPKQEIK